MTVYHCAIRWLSRSGVVGRLHLLWGESAQFMNRHGNLSFNFRDSQWLRDVAFMVDIGQYLSVLNVNL